MNVPDPRVGTVLHGRYKILERRTEGSMGVVYRGERITLKRPVAIKFLHEGYAATDDGRRRFEVEARAMGRLEHPNCVPVTDFGLEQGAPYLVMDFVAGVTLQQLLTTEWRLAPRRAVGIIRQVLAGLAHAHDKGIIHRDIKPANILITVAQGHGEHVRIVDFGLAKLRDEGSFTTGVAVGTPVYMSPEQTIGTKADERADLYACGVILYEMLAGAKLFQAETPFEVMRMHREDPPPPLSTTAAGVEISPGLQAVVTRALAKAREDRFQSASEFLAALEQADEGHLQRGSRRRTVAILALGLAAMAGGAFFAWKQLGPREPAAAPAPQGPPAAARATEPPAEPRAKRDDKPSPSPDAAAAPEVAAAADARPSDGAAIARLRALATETGDVQGAIAGLEQLRAAQPAEPAVHYALANLYAETQAWALAVQSYAATLRLDPGYQTDPRVIADVVEALGSKDAHEMAAKLIEHTLGPAAVPRLEEASRSTNRDLRARATVLVSRMR
jgi:eukaryotic-like serine/threonine-protein kinase